MEDKSILGVQLACRASDDRDLRLRRDIPKIVESILESYSAPDSRAHLDSSPMPNEPTIVEALRLIQHIIFPGYHGRNQVERTNLVYFIGELTIQVYELLSLQITRALKNDCSDTTTKCLDCDEAGREMTIRFLNRIAHIRRMLSKDVAAAFDGDPAAKNHDEIIFCYPGLTAIMIYRIAHELHLLKVPIIPRIMTEYAHHRTGIDIHPGAQIGESFFIDHGTGVVIGETTLIGNQVQLYQGVTLGALRVSKDKDGRIIRGTKRHPTIEDRVTIYAQATILGGDTVIGAGSTVGGNVWLTHSIPPGSTVQNEAVGIRLRQNHDRHAANDYSI